MGRMKGAEWTSGADLAAGNWDFGSEPAPGDLDFSITEDLNSP